MAQFARFEGINADASNAVPVNVPSAGTPTQPPIFEASVANSADQTSGSGPVSAASLAGGPPGAPVALGAHATSATQPSTQSPAPKRMLLGFDVGSTRVKAVLLDGNRVRFADYRRHHADVRGELAKLLQDIAKQFPNTLVDAAITGSGGLTVSNTMQVDFVQEVIAGTEAARRLHPDVDVIIELGGEDAKLTYLHLTPEQRMNGTCAGGTGAFIDQMATLLHTDASGLNDLASRHKQLYPIASRCGVFAKTDLQPLINQGADHEDLAASIFTAVATQTIAGLACGRPIRGTVMFLGGPLHFMPELRHAYEELLPKVEHFVCPENAQLYVAMGAAMLAGTARQPKPAQTLESLVDHLEHGEVVMESPRMRPLFANEDERREFLERHAKEVIPSASLDEAHGRCFLGIDAGSTTIKAVLIDEDDRIVFTHYASNEGDPVTAAVDIVKHLRQEIPADTVIGRSCSTGYGEGLVKTALKLDQGEVETMAHYRAAEYIQPGVTSVIDIGGQDMKYLRIKDHAVDSISVNEACSSGCGSFLQTFAATMDTDVRTFAKQAMESTSPVDLGTRCTVFVNSSVKQAQKEGANVRDISAGLSYSVVRNALYKVIRLKDPSDLGDKVVVQGGTFLNDSVLRAFELLTHRQVIRPNIAGLMGAYGAALTARMHDDGTGASSLATLEELADFQVKTTRKTCRLCQNHCQMTISTFSNGERHVSGNRCDSGASLERIPKKSELPNMFDWKYRRIFGYRRLTEQKATRGDIGIPRVLNMYENYPFWFTMLTQLGFRVMISPRSSHDLFEQGMETIPSENCCYPAKLVHGHIEALLDKGVTTIFYPCVTYEQDFTGGKADNHFNCPVVATYPEVIRNNMERLAGPGVRFISPFVNLGNREYLPHHLCEAFKDWDISEEEMTAALDAAWEEDAAVKREVREKGEESIQWLREHHIRGIVLAGRPYHLDPEINHGIPEVIIGLGMGVLTEDSVCDGRLERPLRVRDQWSYHSRLYEAAARVGDEPDLEMVQLNSFGCGVDAITADQVQEILEGRGDVHTVLKIDEVSNLGATKIRLRSLSAAVAERRERRADVGAGDSVPADAVGVGAGESGVPVVGTGVGLEVSGGVSAGGGVAAHEPGPASGDSGCGALAGRVSAGQTGVTVGAGGSGGSGRLVSKDDGSSVLAGRVSAGQGVSDDSANQAHPIAGGKNRKPGVASSVVLTYQTDGNNADAAPIRRDPSAEAATEEKRLTRAGHIHPRAVFTKEMREAGYEILVPQMAPIQFRIMMPVLRKAGFNVRLLEHTNRDTMEVGLKYVNNDFCYPAIVVIGQLVSEFTSGRANPDKTAVAITQTGGMCRATNYASLLRKALRDAGYAQVPVIAISVQGIEENPGFEVTLPVIHHMIQAVVLGDTLQQMLFRVRPYEVQPGSANRLCERWEAICQEWAASGRFGRSGGSGLAGQAGQSEISGVSGISGRAGRSGRFEGSELTEMDGWSELAGQFERRRVGGFGMFGGFGGFSAMWGGRLTYRKQVKHMVAELNALPLRDEPRRPQVGLVGEILVKFHPDANNHAVRVIEEEGCEAVLPALMQFFHNAVASYAWNYENLGIGGKSRWVKPALLWAMERYEDPVHAAFERTGGKFVPHRAVLEMASRSTDIARMGNQAGEGWYLTAEMVDMIEHGCPNIICAQPFACLPNHIVGKGMFRALRNRYPEANIVAVDYDPGASEVNQLNRIKLMISSAVMQREHGAAGAGAAGTGAGAGGLAGAGAGSGSGVLPSDAIIWSDEDDLAAMQAAAPACAATCPLVSMALNSLGGNDSGTLGGGAGFGLVNEPGGAGTQRQGEPGGAGARAALSIEDVTGVGPENGSRPVNKAKFNEARHPVALGMPKIPDRVG